MHNSQSDSKNNSSNDNNASPSTKVILHLTAPRGDNLGTGIADYCDNLEKIKQLVNLNNQSM